MNDGTHADLVLMPGEWSPGEAARYVTDAYTKSVEAVIETGRRLVEAKAKLPHGQWLPMVELLPFSLRTAQTFMRIADNHALGNTQHVAHLPSSWGTLAVLARLPEDALGERIAAGRIHPDMTRAEAEALVDEWAAPDPVALGQMQIAARCAYGLQGFLSEERRPGIANFPWHVPIDPQIDEAMILDAITALTDMLASIERRTR